MIEQITLAQTFAYLLVFARVGAALALLPGFSAAYVSVRVRLIFALALTLVVHPVVAGDLPSLPTSPAALALLIAGEVSIGSFIAILARIVVAALQVAGTFIAYFSSLASALVQDPVADQQTSTISGFLGTLGLVLIFVTDLHHLMLRAVVESYDRFPAGMMLPGDGFAEAATAAVAASMVIGLQLAAPFLVVALVYNRRPRPARPADAATSGILLRTADTNFLPNLGNGPYYFGHHAGVPQSLPREPLAPSPAPDARLRRQATAP